MGLSDVKDYTKVTTYEKAVYLVTGLMGAKGSFRALGGRQRDQE